MLGCGGQQDCLFWSRIDRSFNLKKRQRMRVRKIKKSVEYLLRFFAGWVSRCSRLACFLVSVFMYLIHSIIVTRSDGKEKKKGFGMTQDEFLLKALLTPEVTMSYPMFTMNRRFPRLCFLAALFVAKPSGSSKAMELGIKPHLT